MHRCSYSSFFFFNDTATTEIYTLSLHDALPIYRVAKPWGYELIWAKTDRYVGKILHIEPGHVLSLQYHNKKDRSEEHTSELQSQSNLVCRLLLEKKKKKNNYIEVLIQNRHQPVE